ncbi:lamin tail domain-containing protein [Candidatus Woesearchaeota archaeon]|nr:lamin tail domain-containing protein [Candidatus Woesearchaeota archaeon]
MRKAILLLLPLLMLVGSAHAMVISEIMAYPSSDEKTNEWIELYNDAEAEIDIANWTLRDSLKNDSLKGYIDAASTLIPAKHYALITDRTTTVYASLSVNSGAIRISVTDESLGNGLNNNGEAIAILDAEDKIIDEVTYPKATKGLSYQRSEAGWKQDFPSPGFPNTIKDDEGNLEGEVSLGGGETSEDSKSGSGSNEPGSVNGTEGKEETGGAGGAGGGQEKSKSEQQTPNNLSESSEADKAFDENVIALSRGDNSTKGQMGGLDSCDWKVELLFPFKDNQSEKSQRVRLRAIKIAGKEASLTARLSIHDKGGQLLKELTVWDRVTAVRQKTSPEISPGLESGGETAYEAELETSCVDVDKGNNRYVEVVSVFPEKNVTSTIEIINITYQNNQSYASFGERLITTLQVKKGTTKKGTITVSVQGEERVSNETRISDILSEETMMVDVSVRLKENCNGKFQDGEYEVQAIGLDTSGARSINISGKGDCRGEKIKKQPSKKGEGAGRESLAAVPSQDAIGAPGTRPKVFIDNTQSETLKEKRGYVSPSSQALIIGAMAFLALILTIGASSITFWVLKRKGGGKRTDTRKVSSQSNRNLFKAGRNKKKDGSSGKRDDQVQGNN